MRPCDICGKEPAKQHVCNDYYCREHYDDHVCDSEGKDEFDEAAAFDDVEDEEVEEE